MKKYYKIAYLYRDFDKVTEADLKILTHINISFGLVKNGRVNTDHLRNTEYFNKYREMNPDIKLILSVGGWGAGGFSTAASTEEGCRIFAESTFEIYEKFKLDGIDIDWEYPCIDSANIDCSPDDKYNFTRLLRYIREALPKRATTSIAAGAGDYFIESTEMCEAVKYLDYVQLMTYDMRGGFSKRTGHHTNLFQPEGDDNINSADHSVKIFNSAGVPHGKLIIGSAFYSRSWSDVHSAANNGLHQPASDVGGFGAGFTRLKEEFIDKNGFIRYWDDSAKAPYLFNGKRFISYDDEESVTCKCRYIKENGLLGIMYWEHSSDPDRYLLKTIGENI